MEDFLKRYPPPPKPDTDREGVGSAKKESRLSPAKMPVEATIDQHGYTVADARLVLDRFVRTASRRGFHKIVVVHGKGRSPGKISPLRKMVREYLETNPTIGATGTPDVKDGGHGATWAILRQRSR